MRNQQLKTKCATFEFEFCKVWDNKLIKLNIKFKNKVLTTLVGKHGNPRNNTMKHKKREHQEDSEVLRLIDCSSTLHDGRIGVLGGDTISSLTNCPSMSNMRSLSSSSRCMRFTRIYLLSTSILTTT